MNVVKKNIQYEYMRTIAIIGVVTIHTFNSAIIYFGKSASTLNLVLYDAMLNMMWYAVPCFLMLSGALLLNPGREISLSKLTKKYVLRMALILVCFGSFFAWVEIIFTSKSIHILDLLVAIKNVVQGNTWAHMWYLYALLGIYALMPIYKLIANQASDKEFKFILFVLFVFTSVLPTLRVFGIETGFYCHVNTVYPFWFLMGAAHNRKLVEKNNTILTLSVVALVGLSTFSRLNGEVYAKLFAYYSVFVVFQATMLFESITTMRIKDGFLTRIVLEIADKSFGIYLVHMFFVNLVYQALKIDPMTYGLLGGGLLVIVNLILSYLIACFMKQIPILKNYL